MANIFTPYVTSEEVRDVVHRFESCDFGPGEFHHSHHVTVLICYLLESTEEEACGKMRAGLLQFLKQHGSPDAYHETITVFWVKYVRGLLDRTDKSLSIVELVNGVVSECSNPRLIDDYYSAERLASEDSRSTWLEPDLRPLDREP